MGPDGGSVVVPLAGGGSVVVAVPPGAAPGSTLTAAVRGVAAAGVEAPPTYPMATIVKGGSLVGNRDTANADLLSPPSEFVK